VGIVISPNSSSRVVLCYPTSMPDYDHSYKLLFSHPEMVSDLLRGFVHEDWVAQVDFATLERFKCNHEALRVLQSLRGVLPRFIPSACRRRTSCEPGRSVGLKRSL
jgi:hypothetical protein